MQLNYLDKKKKIPNINDYVLEDLGEDVNSYTFNDEDEMDFNDVNERP